MINGLDLFSGIGGLSLALNEWVKPVAYCEIDPYCQGVLLSRISDGTLPNAPIWDDIKTLSYDGRNWPGIDIIYGGFPCQDISIAGHGKGLAGERSGLFFEIMRLAKEIKPSWIFLENVPAICSRGGVKILEEITKVGFDARWCVISAKSCGYGHKRDRWFLLAHSYCQSSKQTHKIPESQQIKKNSWMGFTRHARDALPQAHWLQSECRIFRMDDGIPHELDRSRALGNAVVPEQARKAFKILMGL